MLFSRDPGAANVMIAIYRDLTGSTANLETPVCALRDRVGNSVIDIFVKDFASDLWHISDHKTRNWPAELEEADNAKLAEWLVEKEFSLLITGVSDVDDDTPQRLWRAAATASISTHVFLDGDMNVRERFLLDNNIILPDEIYTHSEQAQNIIAQLGGRRDTIHNIENPYLRHIRLGLISGGTRSSFEKRLEWQVDQGESVVLFASENVAELTVFGKPCRYDEMKILNNLYNRLADGRVSFIDTRISNPILIVRPHPKDRPGKYVGFLKASQNKGGVRVVIDETSDAIGSICAADIVVGMKSSLLMEAKHLGVPGYCLLSDWVDQK